MTNTGIKIAWVAFSLLMGVLFLAPDPTQSVVASNGCGPAFPCQISDLNSFLANECFEETVFNGYEPTAEWNFEGEWEITAIARESGFQQIIEKGNGSTFERIFDSGDCSGWGAFVTVNFNTEKLRFTGGTKSVLLDPYCPGGSNGNCGDFKVYRLTGDALGALDYFPSAASLTPRKDDFVIGFNDIGGDSDFDDIIILARWVTKPALPEPNQAVINETKYVTPFVTFFLTYDENGLSKDVRCDNCTIRTLSSIGDLMFGTGSGGTLVDFPYDTPVSASASPDCTYVRTRSGGVKQICP
jgi:hypothetical protein